MRDLRFNQGFPLYRERLAGMLRCIADGQATSDEAVGSYMGVNPYMVEGIRGWLCKTGLGNGTSKNYTLSPFGALVAEHDPDLHQAGTQWFLHYYLVSQHEERAEVWFHCFNEFLNPNKVFSSNELQESILLSLDQTPKNKAGVTSDTKELIKTYTNPAALGDLRLLTRQGKSEFVVGRPNTPDPLIVAYVLFDVWERRFGSLDTVRLAQLISEPESIGRVFVASDSQVRSFISALQSLGMITFADTQHQPVTRRFRDTPFSLLERYYQQ